MDPIGMVHTVLATESNWLTEPSSAAQILSALKSLSNLTEVAGSSSDVSDLLTSSRDLSQSACLYFGDESSAVALCAIEPHVLLECVLRKQS